MNTQRVIVALALLVATSACAVVDYAQGEEGANVSAIRPGISRTQVEEILGRPERSWVADSGVRYSTYEFPAGIPPSPGGAVGMAVFDVLLLGMPEILFASNPDHEARRTTGRIVISYDHQDIAIGQFDEFDELPADGRSTERPVVLGP